jgi:hypothetical protein
MVTIASIVKAQTYISILLVTIFLGKFLAVDANGLNILFSQSDISFVNPHCKNKNSPKQLKNTAHFSQVDLVPSQVIHLSGFCSSQFQFELCSWESNILEPIAAFYEHFFSKLSYLYLDNVSPPPQLV